VIRDRVFPDAAADREPDEAVDGGSDREPVIQPVVADAEKRPAERFPVIHREDQQRLRGRGPPVS
jgi:hypothetical protein